MSCRIVRLMGLVALLLTYPTLARAQIYGSVSAGANHTSPSDVTVTVPAAGLGVTYDNVQFSARPFDSPQYYVWRLGRLLGTRQRFGVEFEFTHLKVIADTAKTYAATGVVNGTALPTGAMLLMNTEVQEYQMTHGLNFLMVNGVARFPFHGGRLALVTRAGLGSVLPHAETSVLGATEQRYQFAGLGVNGSAGLALKLTRILSLVADYKISDASPKIAVIGGTGQTTAISQQVAFGLAFGFAR